MQLHHRNRQGTEAEAPQAWDFATRLTKLSVEDAWAKINSKYGTADRGRDPMHTAMHKTWFVNMTHFLNLRFLGYQDLLQDIDPNHLPRNSYYSANYIHRLVLAQVARLSGVPFKGGIAPLSTDIDDTFAAQTAEGILDYYEERHDWEQMKMDLAWWMCIAGTGVVYNNWDPAKGKLVQEMSNPFGPENQTPIDPNRMNKDDIENLRSLGGVKEQRSGDISAWVPSPFELTIPRGCRTLAHAPWAIIEYEVDAGYFWERWPEKGPALQHDDFSASTESYYWKRMAHMVNRYGFTLPTAGAEAAEVITIRELWIPPSGWCPTGFVAHSTRGFGIDVQPHPFHAADLDWRDPDYSFMRYPFDVARYAPVKGRFWGMSQVENLLGPQQAYNLSIDQMLRQRDRMGAPMITAPHGSEVSPVGDVWYYDAQKGNIQVHNPPVIGQSQMDSANIAQNDMRQLSMQSDPVSGDLPSGVRSAPMLDKIEENDNAPLKPALVEMRSLWQNVKSRYAALAWKFMAEERMVRIYGDNRQADVLAFKGSDLGGNIFFKVDVQSSKIRSSSAIMGLAMELLQTGALNPANPDHLEALLDAVQFKNVDHVFKGLRAHRRRAKHEELMFSRMQPGQNGGMQAPWPGVNDYDDHVSHIQSHQEFMATDEFENWPTLKKMAFMGHIRKHQEFLAEIQMAQASMTAGAPAEGGGGGSPPAEKGQPSPPKPSPNAAPAAQAQGAIA